MNIEFDNGMAHCNGKTYVPTCDSCELACCDKCPLYAQCTVNELMVCVETVGNNKVWREAN